jgi:hypothetical protein
MGAAMSGDKRWTLTGTGKGLETTFRVDSGMVYSGSAAPSPDEWLDVSDYGDAVFWVDCPDVPAGGPRARKPRRRRTRGGDGSVGP